MFLFHIVWLAYQHLKRLTPDIEFPSHFKSNYFSQFLLHDRLDILSVIPIIGQGVQKKDLKRKERKKEKMKERKKERGKEEKERILKKS